MACDLRAQACFDISAASFAVSVFTLLGGCSLRERRGILFGEVGLSDGVDRRVVVVSCVAGCWALRVAALGFMNFVGAVKVGCCPRVKTFTGWASGL